jgi:predicted oxidoreductase
MPIPAQNLVDSSPRSVGGRQVGPLAFGCWRFTDNSATASQALLEAALDHGCSLVDTADVYGLDWGGAGFGACEAQLGAVLRQAPSLRPRMVLATKGGICPGVPYDSSPAALVAACEASLRRLRTDHVDLYQVHRPDPFTHPAQVAATLADLVSSGKVGAVGVSNHTPDQTTALQAHLPFPLASTQPEFSAAQLAPLRDGTMDLAMRANLAVLAWSPLGGGRLAAGNDLPSALADALDRVAEREGVTRGAAAIAFVLAHPSRPVAILGTQRAERIAELTAATTAHLFRADVYSIIEASDGRPLP